MCASSCSKKNFKQSIRNEFFQAKKSEELLFFSNHDINPFVKVEELDWKPFEERIQLDLQFAFINYMNNPQLNFKAEIPSKLGFIFDFKEWNQINKITKEIIPFKREHPSLKSNIKRKRNTTKYIDYQVNENEIIPILLEDDKISYENIKSLAEDKKEYEDIKEKYKIEKEKLVKKVFFNVIKDYHIELNLRTELCFWENECKLNTPFPDFLFILIDEVQNMARLYDKDNKLKIYLEIINQIHNSNIFFFKIIQIFLIEGFLRTEINKFLSIGKSNYYECFKVFYISLVASFKYISENMLVSNYVVGKDIFLYRTSKPNQNEIDMYKERNYTYFSIIFQDFILCSTNFKEAEKSIDFNNENLVEYLWEILVPSYILESEKENLASIQNLSPESNKSDQVMLKSGVVIFIDKIIPYSKVIDATKILKKNKFIVKCILRSFSFESYFEALNIYYSLRLVNLQKID